MTHVSRDTLPDRAAGKVFITSVTVCPVTVIVLQLLIGEGVVGLLSCEANPVHPPIHAAVAWL